MADESRTTSTSTQACQLLPFSTTTHFSLEGLSAKSGHIYRQSVSSIYDYGTDATAASSILNKIELLFAEPKQQSRLQSRQDIVQHHDSHSETGDFINMLERSTGSLEISARQNPGLHHLENPTVTSGENSTENTVARQDSGFYEARGAEDIESNEKIHSQSIHTPWHDFTDLPQKGKGRASVQNEFLGAVKSQFAQRAAPDVHEMSRMLEKEDDETSEVDVDIQAKQLRARERVVISRGRVSRTRRLIRNHRGEVRQLRDDFRGALDSLVRKVNELMATGKLPDISEYTEAFRTAQDKLGPAEEVYDRWEMRLDDEEEDLEEEEDHFYRHHDVANLTTVESKLDEVMSPRIKPYLPADPEPPDLVVGSKIQEYLEKVALANQLKEDLDDLDNDFFRMSGDSEFRKRHNIALSVEATNFLADYPKQHAEILDDLRAIEDDIFDLRDQCLGESLFGESDFVYVHYDALYEDVMDSVYEARERSPLRTAADHMKYKREQNFGDKKEYVNSWLMEWVQYSAVDVLMLKTLIYFKFPPHPKEGMELNDQNWPELAVQNWDTDGAGKNANTYFQASRLDAIDGSPGRLHGTSTGRSGISDSLRHLDESFQDDGMSDGEGTEIEAEFDPTQTADEQGGRAFNVPTE